MPGMTIAPHYNRWALKSWYPIIRLTMTPFRKVTVRYDECGVRPVTWKIDTVGRRRVTVQACLNG